MGQPPIGHYALIGDTRTAALCSREGSIDWLCLPTFGSEPVFGRLVEGDGGGSFSITPEGVPSTTRAYRRGSAVLDMNWKTASGTATLTDAMILDLRGALMPHNLLVRRLRCTEGSIRVRVLFEPRRSLPGEPARFERRQGNLIASWGSLAIGLSTEPSLDIEPGRETPLDLVAGDEITFMLTVADRSPLVFVSPRIAEASLRATVSWWREWSDDISYDGTFRGAVVRSLITLRLLTFAPSGAPVAAPTTSLPETVGGTRNWDYRFSWPRDASIGIAAFLAAGKHKEAHSFMHWLLHASRLTRPRLGVLYTIYGKPVPDEREVHDLDGYRASVPVRIGNAAGRQHQLDVYGWVVDAAWLLTRAGHQLHRETWRAIAGFADFVAGNWRRPDAGIWEVRGEGRHYVHSKLMAWLALDRALRIAQEWRVRSRRAQRWQHERDALSTDIRANGFDRDRQTYVWSYGSSELDAALLLLPVLEFEHDSSTGSKRRPGQFATDSARATGWSTATLGRPRECPETKARFYRVPSGLYKRSPPEAEWTKRIRCLTGS